MGGGLPDQGKTEGNIVQVGCWEQVSYALLGFGQGDFLQAEFELLGEEVREGCH